MNYEHFYAANIFYRNTYGKKIYRLALDGGMTCPNRDGTCGFGGCTFCSERGSGDFTPTGGKKLLSVKEQLKIAKTFVKEKSNGPYLAYFQSFSNTYAPVSYLEELFSQALEPDDILGLSIATRPDCISEEISSLLRGLKEKFKKDIYIELGLQTTNDKIAHTFNRGYDYSVFLNSLSILKAAEIPVIVHMILGLPDETPEEVCNNIHAVSTLGIHGIKLSLLHIIKGTKMETEYMRSPERFHLMDMNMYIKTLCRCIELIPEDVVIYRITGDAPKKLLTAPLFTADKKRVLNSINQYMRENNIRQGRLVTQQVVYKQSTVK